MDDLVEQERERVQKIMNGQLPSETLAVYNLKKFYIIKKPKVKKEDDGSALGNEEDKSSNVIKAVQGISFALNIGECFCLLGVNGAGKTSTFSCLATD